VDGLMVAARGFWEVCRAVLHAFGTAPEVTVVEIESFALEDECADAILDTDVSLFRGLKCLCVYTRAVDVVRRACMGISVTIVFPTASLIVQGSVFGEHCSKTFAKANILKGLGRPRGSSNSNYNAEVATFSRTIVSLSSPSFIPYLLAHLSTSSNNDPQTPPESSGTLRRAPNAQIPAPFRPCPGRAQNQQHRWRRTVSRRDPRVRERSVISAYGKLAAAQG